MRGDGGNKAWSPGRARISRKTIAQGRPVVRLVPVVLPRAFLLHADHGCEGHPVFPAPSVSDEGGLMEKLGRHAPRECGFTSYSLVMPAHAGIQYAAASRFKRCGLWNTGSPGPVSAKASTRLRTQGRAGALAKAASRAMTMGMRRLSIVSNHEARMRLFAV
jgi:hypothetical protein